jgi:hypothetical protein
VVVIPEVRRGPGHLHGLSENIKNVSSLPYARPRVRQLQQPVRHKLSIRLTAKPNFARRMAFQRLFEFASDFFSIAALVRDLTSLGLEASRIVDVALANFLVAITKSSPESCSK